jgi:hypothetical protein
MARTKIQQTARKSTMANTEHSVKRAQLASKKIRIKKEDENGKPSQSRRAPGVVALMDIRRFQKSTGKNKNTALLD